MQIKTFNRLLGFSLFFLAHWFFGNLYEEIVLAPNQLTESYQALKNWQGYFTVTNQIFYYVPFTQIAVFVVCYLYFKAANSKEKAYLKKASIFGLLSIALTALIVTQLNLKLFFGDIEKYKSEIYTLSVIWLIGNAIRLYLVGSSLYFTFKAYLIRQNLGAEKTTTANSD
ncbi:hypothetical protein [Flavobacterium sp. TBRC 19031]|uniref:hypothetical protein n=1 Tax=Flavobacterium mekongense TaxID=3379707 RepID=UPI00399BE4D5